jgi:hypothetical protein
VARVRPLPPGRVHPLPVGRILPQGPPPGRILPQGLPPQGRLLRQGLPLLPVPVPINMTIGCLFLAICWDCYFR